MMRLSRKQLYVAGAVVGGGLLLWWLTRSSTPAAPPAVPGTVTSGSQSTTIDTNVLSPGFGLPLV